MFIDFTYLYATSDIKVTKSIPAREQALIYAIYLLFKAYIIF